ncbi:copper homeostasis protein CutC [Xylocopilactobacillus apicola]|uniref:PF03932 family protein CutC n=1 Tax=Xylocopilactobacillus apicola TaxID=2932184 RepID=A0AAU9DXZ8_9LACO|nr:copper homeostasis protein CutC [Xylocopilactobacillus apicola]BDR59013.1 copper homeostasis protein CutC [Xylocopilactobacillus apicola]
MLYEACIENLSDLNEVISRGAKRIELCDNLAVGGTTVSHGVMKYALSIAHERQVSVATIIRPRGGDFVYNDIEINAMEDDIFQAQQLGADAVVFGTLTAEGKIDYPTMEQLIAAASGMECVMHMAFDHIAGDKIAAITELKELGIDRILTHGGLTSTKIEDNLSQIQSYILAANGEIQILPGGGITTLNRDLVAEKTNANQLHGTKIV